MICHLPPHTFSNICLQSASNLIVFMSEFSIDFSIVLVLCEGSVKCFAHCSFFVDPICRMTQYWLPAVTPWDVCEFSFTHQRILLPSFAMQFKKNMKHPPPSAASFSLSAYSPHCSHSSCVLERSMRLIRARLCVSPKALLAPLAQAAVRSQTAWAD